MTTRPDQREPAPQLAEPRAPAQQLAHDEQRPALADHFERLRDGAELLTVVMAAAALRAVEKAAEICGGRGFFRSFGLERLLRDVHAASFHALPEKRQLQFTGRIAMGFDPITGQPLAT